MLCFFVVLALFSYAKETKIIPELNEDKFGTIIGVWEKHDTNNQRVLYAITEKNVFLETYPNDFSVWRDLESTEIPNLVKVKENTYAFKFLWESDWDSEWNYLEEDEKEIYEDIETLRMKCTWYYVIDKNGDLLQGTYAIFQSASYASRVYPKYN